MKMYHRYLGLQIEERQDTRPSWTPVLGYFLYYYPGTCSFLSLHLHLMISNDTTWSESQIVGNSIDVFNKEAHRWMTRFSLTLLVEGKTAQFTRIKPFRHISPNRVLSLNWLTSMHFGGVNFNKKLANWYIFPNLMKKVFMCTNIINGVVAPWVTNGKLQVVNNVRVRVYGCGF